jgi:Ca2+-binding EF-hand superfamily protein
MKRLLCLPLALACVCLSLRAPAADRDSKTPDDVQTIVYFGDRWPVVIRVHLRIDGEAHREAWQAFMDEMFDYLDVDKSGKLEKKEAAAAPPPGVLVSEGGLVGGGGGPDMDADRDGFVTRAEFREHYRKNGLSPFQISTSGRRSSFVRINARTGMLGGRASSEALNAKLFALLDTNKDGKLSKAELEAAPKILGKLDRDEDEMITPDELLGQAERGTDFDPDGLVLLADGLARGNDSRFVVLADGRTDRAMARRILDRYAPKGKKKVEAKKLGLSKLDRDEDGWLDAEELSRLSEATPDVELVVRLGKRGEKEPFVEVLKKGKSLKKLEATKDGVVLTIDNARLELRGPDAAESGGFRIDAVAQYKTQFKMADADNNGYLDKREAERSPFFRGLFAVMDRDGDGKLYEKEMIAYLDQVAKFRKMVLKGCVSLVLRDEGKGLFDMIDVDGDGRLSVRELRNAAKVLMKLDQDGDGKVAANEVPRNFRGAFELGAAGVAPTSLAFAVTIDGGGGPPPPAARTKGPLWFRKMDRNRDGDVSRAEWLGTDEAFKEIDADGDGLISAEEAEAYDRKKRAKK